MAVVLATVLWAAAMLGPLRLMARAACPLGSSRLVLRRRLWLRVLGARLMLGLGASLMLGLGPH